ncbi:MAG: ABC transporter ATP-binding protein [Candidatus Saccharimonadales bacterium]
MDTKPDKVTVFEICRLFLKASIRHRKEAWLSLLQPVGVGIAFGVAVPFSASSVLAALAQGGDVSRPLIALAAASAIGVACNMIGFNNAMSLQARTMDDLHRGVFNRLMQRSVGFHADRVSGKLVSDALDFISSYGMLSTALLVNSLGFVVSIIVGIVILLIVSWPLGLMVAAIVAITLVWAGLESRTRSALRTTRLMATKKLTSHLSDSIVNAPTVKTFAREDLERKRNAELNTVLRNLRIRDWQRAGRSGAHRIGALLAMQLVLLLFVVYLTRRNPGVLAAGIFAFAYTLALINRLFEINSLTRQVEESLLNASPMTAILREAVEITDAPGAKKLRVTKGEVTISDIEFAYPENIQNGTVFSNFTLQINPGEKVGLVGPSGGGKSTLTRLLLRFDDVQAGTIAVDGQNIANVTQESLRQAIAYVPQEPLLFHRTVRENIAYGRPDATEKELIRATKKANAHDFIAALPNGYDTVVGERGVKLSGGQRQRIAIARAILKDAPLLILDEATSALDSENEVQVQEALWQLMEGRTTLVIAHRLSTIQRMDRIVVLEDGAIKEEGSHKKLLAKKGLYAKLWQHQSGGFLEE